MRRSVLLLTILLALAWPSLHLLAALPPEYAATPTAKDFPQDDVLVLSETRAHTLFADGRVEERVRIVEKVLTYEGLDLAGDPKVAFNSKTQELKVLRSRTYTPEGKTVDTQANGFTEITPFALEKSPDYSDIRQMVITHIGLDVNAVIEKEYTITDKVPWRRFMEGVESVEGEESALAREVIISVPEGMPLKYAGVNGVGDPAISKSGGSDIYTWTFKSAAGRSLADASAAERAFLPALLFTTCPDWGHQASTVGGLVAKAVSESSPALDAKAEELVKNAKSPFEKMFKIHAFVAEAINTVDWPLDAFGFAPRPAPAVLDSGYGHALDKAVLLAVFLKKAGIEAAIAATAQDPAAEPKLHMVPCLARLGEPLVRVDLADGVHWLDPASKLADLSQRDFLGRHGLPLLAGFGELHTMAAVGPEDSLVVALHAKADKDLALEGEGTIQLSGYYSPYYRVQGSAEDLKGFAGEIIASILPGSEISSVSTVRLEPARVAIAVAFKAPAPKGRPDVKTIRTGLPSGSLLAHVPGIHRGSRGLPLVLPSAGTESVAVKIALPEDVKPRFLPREILAEGAAGKAKQSWAFKEGSVELSLEASIPSPVVSTKDYGAFRSLCGTLAADSARAVVF